MRIVAGHFKGKALARPKDNTVRPTSDRVREAVFNILGHGIEDFDLEGARVLDLFAGTGAMGLEALSRGAKYCLFVENSAATRGLIRTNVEAMNLTGVTSVWRRDATTLGPAGNMEPFDLIFCDPPYGKGLGEQALEAACQNSWLATGAVALLEEQASADIRAMEGFEELDRRTYGDTQVLFLRKM